MTIFIQHPWLFIVCLAFLFILFLIMLKCGHQVAIRHIAKDPTGAKIGVTEVESAIFALLGIMIAFAFYGASQRLDMRRQIIVEENNTIGTAWLRIDVLPDTVQPKMRALFREYVDARLGVNQKLPDLDAAEKEMLRADKLQSEIWNIAISAGKQTKDSAIFMSVLPALNAMFDIATSHNVSIISHPPLMIFATLLFLILISTVYVGHSITSAHRTNWLHGVGFATIMIGVFYVIVDLEFPRIGFIHIKAYDQYMIELQEKMN